MEEFKEIIGKWKLSRSTVDKTDNIEVKNENLIVVQDFHGTAVAICGRFDDEEVKTNSKLISAAPDLLLALHEMVRQYAQRNGKHDTIMPKENQSYEVKNAMLAIEKATK